MKSALKLRIGSLSFRDMPLTKVLYGTLLCKKFVKRWKRVKYSKIIQTTNTGRVALFSDSRKLSDLCIFNVVTHQDP